MKKKFISTLLAGLMLLSITSCKDNNSSGGDKEKKTIAIVQIMDHPSLNEIREAIKSELEADSSYEFEFILKDGNADKNQLSSIYSDLLSRDIDMIIPIATPTAQSALSAMEVSGKTDIPVVFSAVSTPVESGVVINAEKPEGNFTGVSDAIPVEKIIDLAVELNPNLKTMGFLYNPSEVNSLTAINKAKAYCETKGISFKDATVVTSADVQQAANSLASDVDAFFTPDDNTVASAMAIYSDVARDKKIPVYCGADSMVKDGGFATIGVNYTELGKKTAKMALKILGGAKIEDTPVEFITEYSNIINETTAEKIDFEISDDLKSKFTLVKDEE